MNPFKTENQRKSKLSQIDDDDIPSTSGTSTCGSRKRSNGPKPAETGMTPFMKENKRKSKSSKIVDDDIPSTSGTSTSGLRKRSNGPKPEVGNSSNVKKNNNKNLKKAKKPSVDNKGIEKRKVRRKQNKRVAQIASQMTVSRPLRGILKAPTVTFHQNEVSFDGFIFNNISYYFTRPPIWRPLYRENIPERTTRVRFNLPDEEEKISKKKGTKSKKKTRDN